MKNDGYRLLTAPEIGILKSFGNYSDNWQQVRVSGTIAWHRIRGNNFMGNVSLGAVGDEMVTVGDVSLHEGVCNSTLMDATIGDHCAIHNVGMLSGYEIGHHCVVFNVNEITASASGDMPWLEPMNECGGRRILPFNGMTIGDAYLWGKYRDHAAMVERLEQMSRQRLNTPEGACNRVGDYCVIKNCKEIHNVAVNSTEDDRTEIVDSIVLSDGVVGYGCRVEYGCIATRFLLGEHVHLEFGVRLNDAVVGDNSTIARCEVGNSVIYPAHEQHHNSSFLIAATIQGQSNLASGTTIGSNHNGRTADNELVAGRGFWPGLCVSLKHSSRFAAYCLLAKGDYPHELNILLPFALVNNNASKNRLEVMPAYWWMYNMYALNRNMKKFAARDKRVRKVQHIEFSPFAPDTAEEILLGRQLLKMWTERAYQDGGELQIEAPGMENSRRKTIVLKAGKGYQAYEDMLIYYALNTLLPQYAEQMPEASLGEGDRVMLWANLGGQLVAQPDLEQLIADIENGTLASWDDVHQRMDQLWEAYPQQKLRHAYQMLCELSQKSALDAADWEHYRTRYAGIQNYVADQIRITRQKDDDNPYRRMTYANDAEMQAVLG